MSDRDVVEQMARELDAVPDGIWEPPGMPRFKTGDRVVVRINLECQYCLDPKFPKCYEKALADDGRTATVYDVGHRQCSCRWDDEPADADHLGHTVWVTWDEQRSYDDPVLESVEFDAHFAPSELRLLPVTPEPHKAGSPCPDCGSPLVSIIFGISGPPACTACLWPHEAPERVGQEGAS